MANVLILYSTVDGQTKRICERLKQNLTAAGHETTLLSLADHEDVDVTRYNPVVIGASVRYGRHRQVVGRFITKNADLLQEKCGALFSVNLVARDPVKRRPDSNPYLQKLLGRIPWNPDLLEVFAGRLDYPSYKFRDRIIIKLIMKITHGPTNVQTVEFTDWEQVDDFGKLLVRAAGDPHARSFAGPGGRPTRP